MSDFLLERDNELTILHSMVKTLKEGHGHVIVIHGEAGIGKTTLVERFLAELRDQRQSFIRTLWSSCEALFTPRPLGPLYDIAQQSPSSLRALLESDAKPTRLYSALYDLLDQSPTILVIEDIHWADEATLDLMTFLARRINRLHVLLLLTFRDDEVTREHPLQRVLGDLPHNDVTRLPLRPLSEGAVATLSQHFHHPPGRLYAITRGNPFFVMEALRYDAPGAPASVKDAVLTRLARRTPLAQRLLEIVAISPGYIEEWLLTSLIFDHTKALEECLAAQMLQIDGHTIAFRHELARQAVYETLLPSRRQALHAELLGVLLARGTDQISLARLAHHAIGAEDVTSMLTLVPVVARDAAQKGAHREALSHYHNVLRYADQMGLEMQAEMLGGLANEQYLTSHIQEAMHTSEKALALWRSLPPTSSTNETIGHTLRRLSRLSALLVNNVAAKQYALEAIDSLKPLPPGHELAMAYANLAHIESRTIPNTAALIWGERAIELAEQINDDETLCYVLIILGAVEIDNGNEDGQIKFRRSLALALEHGYDEHAARCFGNLSLFHTLRREYQQANQYILDGMAYANERNLDPWGHFMRWVHARALFDQGDWAGAEKEALAVLQIPSVAITNRLPALLILGRVRARRGDASARTLLDEARELTLAIGEPHRYEQIAAARAEWRWLAGDNAGCVAEARTGYFPDVRQISVYQAEVITWLWRTGTLDSAHTQDMPLFALEIAGNWQQAAAYWARVGCPWEEALALLEGDEGALQSAYTLFEQLGSPPALMLTRRRLHERGVRHLPRGPHSTTRANPQGLTKRQMEILHLLAQGMSNVAIAHQLSTSPRTIEHHVTALLAKLNARTRAEAIHRSYELGLLP